MSMPGNISDVLRVSPNAKIGGGPKHPAPLVQPNRRHKYNAQRTELGGMKWDSKHEAATWATIHRLWELKQIRWYMIKPVFLVEGGRFVPDFALCNLDGSVEIWDAKGVLTPLYRRSKKQMKERYGIEIKEV